MRGTKLAIGIGALAGALALGGRFAGAEDPPKGGGAMPDFQKKLEHPLAKALVGTWNVDHKSSYGDSTGTTTYALGVGGTAIVQDYEFSMGPMGPFAGHGVWKLSDDGKTMNAWWIDVMSPSMTHFKGALTETGYDVKADDGTRLTLAKTDKGFEFKLYGQGETAPMFTDTYTKK
jgi:hypothetical protein